MISAMLFGDPSNLPQGFFDPFSVAASKDSLKEMLAASTLE